MSWLMESADHTLFMTAAISIEADVDPQADDEGVTVVVEAEYVCAIWEKPILPGGRRGDEKTRGRLRLVRSDR